MPLIERYDSPERNVGPDGPSTVLHYVVFNETNAAATFLVEGVAPAFYDGLHFRNYTIKHLGGDVYEADINYGRSSQRETGEFVFNFDTGGGTGHITQSLATVAKYPASAPDFKGAIGVTADSVEGTDIAIPVYNWTETHFLENTLVDTAAYSVALGKLTGKVNNATFRGWAIGEVLFMGASGGKRGEDDSEISFKFAGSENVTGLTVGDITGIAKKGHEYLWIRYTDEVDGTAKASVKRPVAVYIEQVYRYGDFSTLGIG